MCCGSTVFVTETLPLACVSTSGKELRTFLLRAPSAPSTVGECAAASFPLLFFSSAFLFVSSLLSSSFSSPLLSSPLLFSHPVYSPLFSSLFLRRCCDRGSRSFRPWMAQYNAIENNYSTRPDNSSLSFFGRHSLTTFVVANTAAHISRVWQPGLHSCPHHFYTPLRFKCGKSMHTSI